MRGVEVTDDRTKKDEACGQRYDTKEAVLARRAHLPWTQQMQKILHEPQGFRALSHCFPEAYEPIMSWRPAVHRRMCVRSSLTIAA